MPDLHAQPWRQLRSKLLLNSKWCTVRRVAYELPNGHRLTDFYHVALRPYVVIAAITPDQKMVMLRSWRPAAQAVTLDCPAGFIEDGETAEQAARRELREEAGYVVTGLAQLMHPLVTDPNRGCGIGTFFVGVGATREGEPTPEPSELAQVETLSAAEIQAAWASGAIRSLPTALALMAATFAVNGELVKAAL